MNYYIIKRKSDGQYIGRLGFSSVLKEAERFRTRYAATCRAVDLAEKEYEAGDVVIIRQQTTAITCDGCEELDARDARIAELTEALRNLLGAVSHNYVYNTNAGGLDVLNTERILNGEK